MMNLKESLRTTLLLAIGFVVHLITPGIFFGMKMDFLLIAMFISLVMNRNFKNCILTSFLAGILSAMATSFPGGQILNIIDKLITGITMYLLIRALGDRLENKFVLALLGFVGTLLSGSIFLYSAKLILAMDIDFKLIYLVVLPAAAINAVGLVFLEGIVARAVKSLKTA